MAFQENLRYYREKAGYKQAKEFAKKLDITYTTYVGYENKGREPKYDTLCKIADLLNVSTDELLGRENNILGSQENERLKKTVNNLLAPINKERNSDFRLVEVNADEVTLKNSKSNIPIPIIANKTDLVNKLNKNHRCSQYNEGVALFGYIWELQSKQILDKLDEKLKQGIHIDPSHILILKNMLSNDSYTQSIRDMYDKYKDE